jgi:hypothetical protein
MPHHNETLSTDNNMYVIIRVSFIILGGPLWRVVSWHRVNILRPTYIMYRNSEIGNSDSDFSTRNHNLFSDDFPMEICGIPGSEA